MIHTTRVPDCFWALWANNLAESRYFRTKFWPAKIRSTLVAGEMSNDYLFDIKMLEYKISFDIKLFSM